MSLKDKIESHAPRSMTGTCRVEVILKGLSVQDAADLVEALGDSTVGTPAIKKALAEHCGVEIGKATLQRHRNNSCFCAKETK